MDNLIFEIYDGFFLLTIMRRIHCSPPRKKIINVISVELLISNYINKRVSLKFVDLSYSKSKWPTLWYLADQAGRAVPALFDLAVHVAAVPISEWESVVAGFPTVDDSVAAVSNFPRTITLIHHWVGLTLSSVFHLAKTAAPVPVYAITIIAGLAIELFHV